MSKTKGERDQNILRAVVGSEHGVRCLYKFLEVFYSFNSALLSGKYFCRILGAICLCESLTGERFYIIEDKQLAVIRAVKYVG